MTHSEIYWLGDRFHCTNDKLEAAHELILESNQNAKKLIQQMNNLGFGLEGIALELFPERRLFFYPKGLRISDNGFTIKEMGTCFNICFNLISYAVATNSLGVALRIYGGSFQGCLPPLLYRALENYFQSESIDVYKQCPYFADSQYLKCTVNPAISCKQCEESPQLFKNTSLEWIRLGDWRHVLKYQDVQGLVIYR